MEAELLRKQINYWCWLSDVFIYEGQSDIDYAKLKA